MLLPKPVVFAALVLAFFLGHCLMWLERVKRSERPMTGQPVDADKIVVNERLA